MKFHILIFCLFVVVGAIAGCGSRTPAPAVAPPQQVTVVVESTVLVPGPTIVTTQLVEVTPTALALDSAGLMIDGIDTGILFITHSGDPGTLDPALSYDSYGITVIGQVYETLVTFNGDNTNELVPQLAAEMPDVSADGLTYTFTLREGITFHDGGELTAEDVTYSFRRGLLQGGYSSPQLLLTEPLLGVGIYDVSELLFRDDPEAAAKNGDPAAVAAADPAALLATCETVTAAIHADGNTVTFRLAQPWAPFLVTLAGGWGAVMDREWAVANGAWDGDCATWQNHYSLMPETDPLHAVMNGSGPYEFDRWEPQDHIRLTANEEYWRTAEIGPAWEGGPTGPPAIQDIIIEVMDEWSTAYAMMQAGDLDIPEVPAPNYPQMDRLTGEICDFDPVAYRFECAMSANPDMPFRLMRGYPSVSRGDLLFNWAINAEIENLYIGSGQLDGNGIPPDFFSDVHVRRAFNYCFDWETYISDVFNGEAVQNIGVVLPGMLGYNPDGSHYAHDLDRCAEELAQAWGGVLPETGFRLQFVYPVGAAEAEVAGAILQQNFEAINPDYALELVGTTIPGLIDAREANLLPIVPVGWHEDYHDPHNWAQPHFAGFFRRRTNWPDDLNAQLRERVNAAVATTNPTERQVLYEELNEMDYENALAIRLVVPLRRQYRQRWVHSDIVGPYYYAYRKE